MFDGKVNFLGGITRQELNGDYISHQVKFSETWLNQYLQIDYAPWDFLKLIAGVQFNQVPGTSLDISPRWGLIANFTKEIGIKLLYGNAFRAAYANGKVSASPNLFGNPNLASEKIATLDAQLFYTSPKFAASLTYYMSDQQGTIGMDPSTSRPGNTGGAKSYGIEFETKWMISPSWSFTGSMSYQENHDLEGRYGIGLIPNFMAKAGISYLSPQGISLGLFNSFYSAAEKIPGATIANPPADEHNWMTFKASVPLKAITSRTDIPNMIFSIYGENLLVEDVYFPEFFRGANNTFPLRTGVAVHGSVTMKF